MKKLLMCFVVLCVGFLPLWSSSSAVPQDDELLQIIEELKSLNDEQLTIIQNSQIRNEELEKLSESRQKTIDEQKQIIDELQNCSKEQKKSSIKETLNSILVAAASFLIGCAVGVLFL